LHLRYLVVTCGAAGGKAFSLAAKVALVLSRRHPRRDCYMQRSDRLRLLPAFSDDTGVSARPRWQLPPSVGTPRRNWRKDEPERHQRGTREERVPVEDETAARFCQGSPTMRLCRWDTGVAWCWLLLVALERPQWGPQPAHPPPPGRTEAHSSSTGLYHAASRPGRR